MKHILRFFIALTFLTAWLEGSTQNLSNRGREFWVGYGHHQFMETGANTQEMVLYLSAEQPATVTVSIFGTPWVRTYTIPANSVIISDFIPKAGANDATLITTPCSFTGGVPPCGGEGNFTNKAIHIESDVPIVAYAHIYGSASSGATMLMPEETWGYSYISMNSKQTYAANCFSWAYVIATHDNTVIEIIPSQTTRSGKPANIPYNVTLNRGEIYQFMAGPEAASTKPELTGSKIRSVANAAGDCFPIAVFSGSSRTNGTPVTCGAATGGDNDNQQVFPSQAWGKRYLTAPTSNSNTASLNMFNTFKILVKDPGTLVYRNGTQIPLGSIDPAGYYTIVTNQPEYITANKPIMVGQFIHSGSACFGGGGVGDPEMMYISPVEQGSKRVGFYRNDEESIVVNYVTIIIPTNGIPSLRIDGSATFDHSYAHPRLAGYSVVVKRWSAAKAQAIVSSDSAFTAITYGLGSVESYGYNAGTLINNLNAVSSIQNTLDPATAQHAFTCINTPVKISALIAYQPTRIEWNLSQLGTFISPNADVIDNAPVTTGTVVINGITYYQYELAGTYEFSVADTFEIPIRTFHPEVENCYNREDLKIAVIVKGRPTADFTFTHSGCTLDPVAFAGAGITSNAFTIRDFNWTFPGPVTATGQNVSQTLPPGTHNISLGVVTNEGCVADTTKQITVYDKPPAEFMVTPSSVCAGASFTITDTSSASIAVTEWYWDFGNSITQTTTSATVNYSYATPGTYTIKHVAKSSTACVSDTVRRTVIVYAPPVVSFTNSPATGCLDATGVVQFAGSATTPDGQAIATWAWNFDDPAANAGNPNTSSLQNPSHIFLTGTYDVSLTVTTVNGCTQTTTVPLTFNARPVVTVSPDISICLNGSTVLTASGGTTYAWEPATGLSATTGNSVTAEPTTTTTYQVIGTTNGCNDTTTVTVTVDPLPNKPLATSPVNYCQGATAVALSATADAGHTLTWFDNTNLSGGSSTAPIPSTATAGTFYFYVNQTNSATTCTGDTTRVQVNVFAPITNNTIGSDQTICAGTSPATIISTATISGGSGIFTFQWQQSTDGGTTWTNITAATNEALDPAAATGAIRYRRIVSDGLCSSTSNVVLIDVQGSMSNFDISATQVICDGQTPALLNGQTPLGGSGTFAFQWESSPDNSLWTAIAGATSEDYQPPAITTTTYYRRKVNSGACAATSSVVTITVNPSPNGSITGAGTICSYDGASVTFASSAGTAPFNIVLSIAGPAGTTTMNYSVPDNLPATINVLPVNSLAGNYTITLAGITDNTGCARTTGLNNVSIVVNAQPAITLTSDLQICGGESATLTAIGATTYAWSPAAGLSAVTGSSVTANPAATTTYRVIGTTNGCNDTAFVTVSVNPVPNAPLTTATFTYCQNSPAAILSATGDPGNTLTWYDNSALTGGTTTAYTPSTATAGTFTYYVTQTNATSCESVPAIITVTVTPSLINNTINADQTICAGTPAAAFTSQVLTGGTGTYTYQWQQSTDGGTNWTDLGGANASTYNPGSPTVTTQYRRLVTSGPCSGISNVVTVTVQSILTNFEISADQSICDGSTPALLDGQIPMGGSGTFGYQWESSTDNTTWTSIAGATGEDYQPPVISSSTYYRRKVTSGACSITSSVVLITVNPSPNGSITGPASICAYENASVTFSASTGTAPFNIELTITGPAGVSTINQVINGNGPVSIPVIPSGSAAGSYTIDLTNIADATGCFRSSGLSSVSVTVNAQPVVTTSANVPICAGTSTTLTSAGATSYAWSPATGLSTTTGNSVIASPAATTTYRVIGTTNGCSDTAFITVTVNQRPTNAPVPGPIEYCLGSTATPLTATTAPGNTLMWYNNPGLTGGSPIAPTPSTATVGTTTYYVTQINPLTGCVSDASEIDVKVNPNPIADFTLPTAICMPNGSAVFQNNSTVSDNTALTYVWDFGDGTGTSTVQHPSYVYNASGSYSVTVTATSATGCTNTSAPKVLDDFFDKPIADFSITPAEICQGVTTSIVENSSAPNSTVVAWHWDFDDNTPVVTDQLPIKQFANAGVFDVSLKVTNAVGCQSDIFNQTVTVHLQPVIDAGRSFVVPQGTTIQFEGTANSTGLTLSWTPAANLSDATILNPSLLATVDETYTLTATGDFGCTATDFITVKILKPVNIPNVFSPNGDGVHDKWMIPNLVDYPGCTVEVFNRYGQQVFYSVGYNTPWDGTLRGKDLPVGAYYYVIHLKNGFKPISGSITILK